MEKTALLLEYLKEQYAQARQHETRQTNATTFLTAAAGVILGLMFKDGIPRPDTWWIGLVVFLIGLANLWINNAHFEGNRFHTSVAGATRRALETAITGWAIDGSDKPTTIRSKILEEHGLRGPDISIGYKVHRALRFVPIGIMAVGIVVVVAALLTNKSPCAGDL